jgi:hypothetical protein
MRSEEARIWKEATKLGCPNLRYSTELGKWVALEKDPCPKCNGIHDSWFSCHYQGKPFDEKNRFRILNDKPNNIQGEK